MRPRDINLPLLESVARAFGPLHERFVFIGGCVNGLLITDTDAPVCRWTVGSALVDVMPTDERVLGFGNRWYRDPIRTAEPFPLPNSGTIRPITAPLFLATKLEAFRGRGGGDYYASHDLEDIVALIDGRPGLLREIAASRGGLREFLTTQIAALLDEAAFIQALPAHLPGDQAGQGRLPIVMDRMRQIAAL